MEQSTKGSLCKSFRAAGLPKEKTHILLNTIEKWVNSNGKEWTVDRLKNLHNWYITQLSGKPNIPSWFAHKGGLPKGPFKWVFQMKNTQCALAVLSGHTVFTESEPSVKQWEKLKSGLNSNEVRFLPWIKYSEYTDESRLKSVPKLRYESPTYTMLTAISIPLGRERLQLRPGVTRGEVAKAYVGSWMCIPSETEKFLRDMRLMLHCPPMIRGPHKEVIDQRKDYPVGHLNCIQESSLKARWVANPNRVTQHFLLPLKREWTDWLKRMPTDCTYNQVSGVVWAAKQLKSGVELAGVDLTSASDKISLWPSLDLIHTAFCGITVNPDSLSRKVWSSVQGGTQYIRAVDHFAEISRAGWLAPDGSILRWKAGQPLGTGPSFALLGLTNNLIGRLASKDAGLPWQDSFRVIGDDIVMRSELFPHYTKRITQLGGEVNISKTMVSSQAVEFAVRVVTPDTSFLKRIKVREISDNTFMAVMSRMGPQASWLLRPRQRHVWNELRHVPGVAVDGDYYQHRTTPDPLSMRYLWYLEHVARERIMPDPPQMSSGSFSRHLELSLKEVGVSEDIIYDCIPLDLLEGVQPSNTAYHSPVSGDPRLVNGKTLLEGFELLLKDKKFVPYLEWRERQSSNTIECREPGHSNVSSNLVPHQTSVRKGGRSR